MNIIGIDLGASNGRVIVGKFETKKKLELDIVYRFKNYGVSINKSLYWDIVHIFNRIMKGLRMCSEKYKDEGFESLGITTWGVDFALLDENDELLGLIHHYRDHRTDAMLEKLFKVIPKEEIFAQTGIQFMSINTIVQLFSMLHNKSPQLTNVKTFLMLPDYFNFLLSGKKLCESSEASTSQLFNPTKKNWAFDLIKKLKLDPNMFPEIIQPGTILGNIQKHIAEEIGLNLETKICIPPTHDTGSAVAAVPVNMDKYGPGEWAYLSSGTWSLLGVELNEPLINEKALNYNFTNEGGINSTIRFLKNISGLWLIQECKKVWDRKHPNLNWEEIEQAAEITQPFQNFFYPDDPTFLNPPNMIEKIQEYLVLQNQSPPKTVGQISRCIFENLAFRYRQVLEILEEILGTRIKILHIIGGGSQNNLLNQFTANVLNIPVNAGPSEATAIGNILSQVLALGGIDNLKNLRQIVRSSFQIKAYNPKDYDKWNEAYKRYKTNVKQ
jgi:sugar (pentulose or hexulose) kinase